MAAAVAETSTGSFGAASCATTRAVAIFVVLAFARTALAFFSYRTRPVSSTTRHAAQVTEGCGCAPAGPGVPTTGASTRVTSSAMGASRFVDKCTRLQGLEQIAHLGAHHRIAELLGQRRYLGDRP